MIQEHIEGSLIDITEDGIAVINAVIPNLDRALMRKYEKVEIILNDGRKISPEQRRKCYALIGEIAEYIEGIKTAETVEATKEFLKLDFMLKRMESMERKIFSLANCDVTTAREFINYLVDFIIKNDIPTKVSLIDNCEDIQRYIYACLVNKKCCVCGQKADIHHLDRIGMGGDRTKINHLGLRALPLCREHHTILHGTSEIDFMKKYHLEPVKIDKKIAKVYHLNTKGGSKSVDIQN